MKTLSHTLSIAVLQLSILGSPTLSAQPIEREHTKARKIKTLSCQRIYSVGSVEELISPPILPGQRSPGGIVLMGHKSSTQRGLLIKDAKFACDKNPAVNKPLIETRDLVIPSILPENNEQRAIILKFYQDLFAMPQTINLPVKALGLSGKAVDGKAAEADLSDPQILDVVVDSFDVMANSRRSELIQLFPMTCFTHNDSDKDRLVMAVSNFSFSFRSLQMGHEAMRVADGHSLTVQFLEKAFRVQVESGAFK